MATLEKLFGQGDQIIDEIFVQTEIAENERETEFLAAVKIQSWFRAQRVRAYLKHLNQSATLLQRTFRGFLGRRKYRQTLQDLVYQMKVHHFHAKATKIQKVWRGYYTRKYIFNFYSRKRYLEALVVKNEITRAELEDYQEQQEERKYMLKEEEERKRVQDWATKNHHLISTKAQPGIYNSPFQPFPDEMEFHLRNAKPSQPKKKETRQHRHSYDPTWKRYDLPTRDPLPPVHPKPQGPFRSATEVQKQRYKPFKPTLRVETAYTSIEEARREMKERDWVARVADEDFQPFSKRPQKFEPSLHQTSQYGHLPYGNRFFRHEYVDKFISPQNFKTVVPPVPIFDKLNDTYSQGEV